jgi:hypothetical protein
MGTAIAANLAAAGRRARIFAVATEIRRRFERDLIPYALETDCPLAGFEPLHLEIRSAELHPA